MFTILDIECTYQGKWGSDDSDGTPYNALNKLVSVGYKTTTGEQGYLIFHHKMLTSHNDAAFRELQDVLNRSKLVIGHNLKFDMSWLFESGFKYEGAYYDTMIFEYVNARGLKLSLRLKDVLQRFNLPEKLDILEEYCGRQGLNVDEVPLDKLIEYGMGDVNSTYDLYFKQVEMIKNDPAINSMKPALKLMNEFLEVLIDVERNGIKIDMDALNAVEADFKKQHQVLEGRLKKMLLDVMGHTPINLNNPEHISWILHSVKVKDKNAWKVIFNLGTEERNGVVKKKYVKRYDPKEFREILRENCRSIRKTRATQCASCGGTGYIQRFCKDGTPRKNKNICSDCNRTGLTYTDLPEIAGFRIAPISYEYASDGGFSTGKDTLEDLLHTGISDEAREFIELYREYNAISSYISTFVEGIRKNVRATGLLHTNFNQCVTSTGRLSSTRPNLQNQPREKTFPIRKVFVSRFKGGKLTNADFKQLEFRVAAFLAQCSSATADILNNIDVHQQTADWITDAGQSMDRQGAKIRTFRPLYGGTMGTDAEQAYFAMFFKKYDGIFKWHETLCEAAVTNKQIQTPSGRIYAFPNCTRRRNGGVSFHTQIKNYPVQGFATGDILPVTMIEMFKQMKQIRKERGLKSVLCLTVHDSIVADTHPDEFDIINQVFEDGFARTIPALEERFGIKFNIPLDFDLESGYNLLNKEKINLKGAKRG